MCLQLSGEPTSCSWTKGVDVRNATAAGVTVTGLLGVVAKAKHAGLIDLARPVLDDLIEIARFWIGPDLYKEVLAQLGEA